MSKKIIKLGLWTRAPLLLTLTTLLFVAALCVGDENLFHVRNSTDISLSVSIVSSFNEIERVIGIATGPRKHFSSSVSIDSDENIIIYSDTFNTTDFYTFIIRDNDDVELFRRSLTREELGQRDWTVVITDSGIE